MSHPIYFFAIEEQARNIEQLCCSSLTHLKKFKTLQHIYHDKRIITEYDIEHTRYVEWLSDTVSDKLLQICTKIRIFQDSYKYDWEPSYFPEVEAFMRYPNIAEVIEGKITLSLRECCNKAIHALNFEIIMITSQDGIEYWGGELILSGMHNKKSWRVKIDLYQFCLSIRFYLRLFN